MGNYKGGRDKDFVERLLIGNLTEDEKKELEEEKREREEQERKRKEEEYKILHEMLNDPTYTFNWKTVEEIPEEEKVRILEKVYEARAWHNKKQPERKEVNYRIKRTVRSIKYDVGHVQIRFEEKIDDELVEKMNELFGQLTRTTDDYISFYMYDSRAIAVDLGQKTVWLRCITKKSEISVEFVPTDCRR